MQIEQILNSADRFVAQSACHLQKKHVDISLLVKPSM